MYAMNERIGDPCVGKTALTQVFVNGSGAYPKNYLMTVGADFTIKQIPVENTNVVVEFYIFDSAGQSIFNQVEMNSKYVCDFSAESVVRLLKLIIFRFVFHSGIISLR